jgi:hypothetical protein
MSYYGEEIPYNPYHDKEWLEDWHPATVINEKIRHVQIKMNDTDEIHEDALDFKGEFYIVPNGFYQVINEFYMSMMGEPGSSSKRVEVDEATVIMDGGPVLKPTT